MKHHVCVVKCGIRDSLYALWEINIFQRGIRKCIGRDFRYALRYDNRVQRSISLESRLTQLSQGSRQPHCIFRERSHPKAQQNRQDQRCRRHRTQEALFPFFRGTYS